MLPQLYLSATPHLFIGVHERGRFDEIRKHDLNDAAMAARRRAAAGSFERLGRVLELIQALVVEHGKRTMLSFVCVDGVMKVYKREGGKSRIPDDIQARFDVDDDTDEDEDE